MVLTVSQNIFGSSTHRIIDCTQISLIVLKNNQNWVDSWKMQSARLGAWILSLNKISRSVKLSTHSTDVCPWKEAFPPLTWHHSSKEEMTQFPGVIFFKGLHIKWSGKRPPGQAGKVESHICFPSDVLKHAWSLWNSENTSSRGIPFCVIKSSKWPLTQIEASKERCGGKLFIRNSKLLPSSYLNIYFIVTPYLFCSLFPLHFSDTTER